MEDSTEKTPHRIMVVDDEEVALKQMRRILEKEGYVVSTFTNPVRALERLEEDLYDLVITDLKMPYLDGLALLNEVKRHSPYTEVILITGYATIDSAVEATKQGAFHYLAKPFTPDQVRDIVARALREKALRERGLNRMALGYLASRGLLIIGESPRIRRVEEEIRQVAPAECNVLISGESGTGKELIARAIHAHSQRAKGPFVAFNCGAFSEDLIANELFGHEKEAFTGAASTKPGILESANSGTLFLDEIGDMPVSMQIKLLRVIQEREVIRVGGTRPIPLDIRIIAATAKDLKTAVNEGLFRQDLYFRLNVVGIALPRLNERRQDIPLLAYHFLGKFQRRTGKGVRAILPEAMALLQKYTYPGNVRELENIIERAVALCQGSIILVRDLPQDLATLELYSFQRSGSESLTLVELERDYIRHILNLTGGIRSDAAQILGIDRVSLWRKLKKYGLE